MGKHQGPDTFILSNNPNIASLPAFLGENRTTITFGNWDANLAKSPVVDKTAKTIDVSSIFAEAVSGVYDCAVSPGGHCISSDPKIPLVFPKLVWQGQIGWTFGPVDPVPYVVNPDGTYTATWNAVDSGWGFGGFGNDRVAFTFSAITSVPEPTPMALFAAGIAILLVGRRRYRS